jgi:hypothetical protein
MPLMSEHGWGMELLLNVLIYLALIKFTISNGLVIYSHICWDGGLKKILYYRKPISSVVLLRPCMHGVDGAVWIFSDITILIFKQLCQR